MKIRLLFTFLFSSILLVSYQNCSDAIFSTGVHFSQTPVNESFVRTFGARSVDVLFVVDDSVSMRSILENVGNGVSSIAGVNFPSGTRIGVTYASPAKINVDGSLDLNRSHNNYAVETPGFLRLVTDTSITNYLNTSGLSIFPDPADADKAQRYEDDKVNMSNTACDMAWFDPMDPSSPNCLEHIKKTPLYPTGIEAGLTSLKQLAQVYTQNQALLFRPDAAVFVIFVSDTHDPGASVYYGEEGNPASIPTYSEMRQAILANNANVASIKFSGIVPLPPQGSPLLDGLKVIGPIPDIEEYDPLNPSLLTSRVYVGDPIENRGEKLRDYSYLSVIKPSQGVVLHPTSNDWSAALSDMLSEVEIVDEVRLQLKQPVSKILSLRMNGVELDPSEYFIDADLTSVVVQTDFDPNISYSFSIDYL